MTDSKTIHVKQTQLQFYFDQVNEAHGADIYLRLGPVSWSGIVTGVTSVPASTLQIMNQMLHRMTEENAGYFSISLDEAAIRADERERLAWRPIEEAPKFRPLLGFASGVTFSMMWKSDNAELNKAIKKFLKHTPPLEPSGAGWCAYAYGQYCRKSDGEFFFVNPTHFIPLSAIGIPGEADPLDRTEQSEGTQ